MIKNFSWVNTKLKSGEAGGAGMGVYAEADIVAGELLCIWGGHVISFREEATLPESYRDLGIQISDEFILSPIDHAETADHFNHSCEPNAGIKGQIFLVAMRDIHKGESVTFDYAMCLSYSEKYSPYYYKIECLCGSNICRKYITADDWKIPYLQQKYKGFFQYYIQEKIDNLNNINA